MSSRAAGAQEHVTVGSQLIAVFPNRDDVQVTLDMVRQLVEASLGHGAASLEVAMGSVTVFITFLIAGAMINRLVNDLLQSGANVSYTNDSHSNIMKAVVKGVQYVVVMFSDKEYAAEQGSARAVPAKGSARV